LFPVSEFYNWIMEGDSISSQNQRTTESSSEMERDSFQAQTH